MEAPEAYNNFYKRLLTYLDALPAEKKTALLYESIATVDNETLFLKLADTIGDLHLLDLEQVNRLIALENFQMQKRATKIITYDKLFYSSHDIEQLRSISEKIKTKFKERGSRSMKKQLLSSKEKEVWTCECGKTNDIGAYCAGCRKDIYGFTAKEITPPYALKIIEEKIGLISEYIEI
jgi:CDGSH-type Zn-finger protein